MEIIVLVKQVPDVALNIKVKEGEIVEEGLSYVISSWDETALEAALQITEDVGGEVTLLTVGPEKASEAEIEHLGNYFKHFWGQGPRTFQLLNLKR